jgi:serine/threonine protein kinase
MVESARERANFDQLMSEQISTPVTRASPSIPEYELLRPIGRGAYGEVWLARNLTGSFVALKIVHRAAFDHDRPFARSNSKCSIFMPYDRCQPRKWRVCSVQTSRGSISSSTGFRSCFARHWANSRKLSAVSNDSARSMRPPPIIHPVGPSPKSSPRLTRQRKAPGPCRMFRVLRHRF